MKLGVYDLIVVGSGAAGLAAACTAAALGQRVIVLEASDRVGGTTAVSGGMVWIPANTKMRTAGIPDSLDAAREYLECTVPGARNDVRLDTFLTRGDEAILFLEAHTSLRLQPVVRYPDYYPDLAGATDGGRVLEPVPFDARALGPAFRQLRDPLPEFLLLGGMMVSRQDLGILRRVGRSPKALWHATKLVARYAVQRLRTHRGTTLVLGNALVARLYKSARDLGVEFALDTPVTDLCIDGNRVVGVQTVQDGTPHSLHASHGVILATGGISHHQDLRRAYVPATAGTLSATVDSGAKCSGAHLAARIGARLTAPGDQALAFWVPVSRFRRADGTQGIFPHTVTDRAKPGLIAVDGNGRRFVNEAASYHEFVRAQLREADTRIPAWLVCDKRFLWKYGLGRVRPFALSVRDDVQRGYLKQADTLDGLATQLGLPSAQLSRTVQEFNVSARHGLDPAFGRGDNSYQRHLGDTEQQPNPCVAPIEHGPFYAVAVSPADLGMAAGIVTDDQARVVNGDGQHIPGLYACGNDMQSVMNGAYPGPGITIGPALVFGYIAASHASKHSGGTPPSLEQIQKASQS